MALGVYCVGTQLHARAQAIHDYAISRLVFEGGLNCGSELNFANCYHLQDAIDWCSASGAPVWNNACQCGRAALER